jgi:hypothetical protein
MKAIEAKDRERLGKTIHKSNTPEGQEEVKNIKSWIEMWERKIAAAEKDIQNTLRNLGRLG